MAEAKKKIRIGDLLVQNDVITEQQLMTALREQKNTGRKLGRTLIDLGYVEESYCQIWCTGSGGVPA
jgi:MSHA biogenesis protein MshE